MKICPEGHYYDGDRFAECPYCGKEPDWRTCILTGFEKMYPDRAILLCALAWIEYVGGVSFAIYRDRLANQDPLLFFVESDIAGGESLSEADTWPAGAAGQVWQTIEGYSSGIRVEGLWGRVVLFRLDETNIRKSDLFYGHPDMGDPPDYIFTWPGAGEFACALGEVVDGKMIPLLREDFVMK